MKRLIMLILTAMLLLCACQKSEPNHTETQGDLFVSMSTCYGFQNVEDNNAFLNDAILPDNFIDQSQLSILGTFKSACYYYVATNFPYRLYSYKYTDATMDANNAWFEVVIGHGSDKWFIYDDTFALSNLPAGMSDMRALNTAYKEGTVLIHTRHGLEYHYLSTGILQKIVWYDGDIQIRLVTTALLGDYDFSLSGKDSIIYRLLDLDENVSKAAFEELKAYMKANTPPAPSVPIWPYFAGSSVLLAAVYLIVLQSYRRIKAS